MIKKNNWINYIAMTGVGILFVFPLYWILISSFKTDLEISQFPPKMFPEVFQFKNYQIVWKLMNFSSAFKNSIFVSFTNTFLNVILATMGGYALAKKRVIGAKILLPIIISTLIMPPAAMILPNYFIISKIGLYDNLWGIILPFAVSTFGIFFMRNYIADVPNELIEAARIDGAGEYRILFTLIMPLIKPALVTLTLISFVNNWNAFTMPLVLISSESKFTLPLRQAMMVKATDSPSWALVLAGTVLAIMPIVILFLLTQKHFVKGVMDGAVKG